MVEAQGKVFKKGQGTLQREKREGEKSEKQQTEHQCQRRKRRRSFMSPEQISPAAHEGPHSGAVERCKRKYGVERNRYLLTIAHPSNPSSVPLIASLNRLGVTCGDSKGGGEKPGVKE